MSTAEIAAAIGDPRQVDAELEKFRQDTGVLSSDELIKRYPRRWIAIHGGRVQAEGRSVNEVLNAADRLGLPRDSVVIQYIDRTPRTMIL